MPLTLTQIRGRAAGAGSGAPKFQGTLSGDGVIRIDCQNYLEHWQEIHLPEEVVTAWREYRIKHIREQAAGERA